jgi:hypothetical protein
MDAGGVGSRTRTPVRFSAAEWKQNKFQIDFPAKGGAIRLMICKTYDYTPRHVENLLCDDAIAQNQSKRSKFKYLNESAPHWRFWFSAILSVAL